MIKKTREITTGDLMHVHGCFGAQTDYTVRLSVRLRDPVDSDILQAALVKTQQRYPYFSVRLRRGEKAFYYEDNPLPVVLLHTADKICLNSEQCNYHCWAVCQIEDMIHLDFFHGLSDGDGMYHVLSTLLYYYCRERYGTTEHQGIRTLEDLILPDETLDPQDSLQAPESIEPAEWKEAFTLETDGGLTPSGPTLWDVEIPEEAFMNFTSANDASPGTMISLLFARAIDSLYPNRKKEIISAYVINARPMLHAKETCHNCLGMAVFEYSDRIKAMPLQRQCTVYRGMTFIQSDEDRVVPGMAANAAGLKQAALAAQSVEEKKELFGQMFNGGEGLITFLVSYTGKWKHPQLGDHMLEFWTHPPNTFSLMAEIAAAGGKIFLSIQQRFREDCVREAFLKELSDNQIPWELKRVMASDIADFPEPCK